MPELLIRCQAAATVPLAALQAFQGSLKRLSPANAARLRSRLESDGFAAPIFVWLDGTQAMILDGHQRLTVLRAMEADGWMIPPLPVAWIEAKTEAEARRLLLSISSQYGEFELSELATWLARFDDDIAATFRLVDAEIALEAAEPDDEHEPSEGEVIICPKCGHTWQA